MSESQRQELDELLNALIDEQLGPAQWERLKELLAEDQEARRMYRQAMFVEALMERFQGDDTMFSSPMMDAKTQERVASRARRIVEDLRGYLARPTPLSIAVAALFMGLLLTAMAYVAVPIYRSLATRSAPAVAEFNPTSVAQITGKYDVVWTESPAKRALASGERLQLQSGILELTFNDGAVVVLKGPADCVIDSPSKSTLRRGLLSADVKPEAIGFELATPGTDVVDLGTKFGVEVWEGGSGEVHVLAGSVELRDRRSPDAAGRVLVAGEAWQFTAQGQQTPLAESDAKRFSFSVPKPTVATFQAGQLTPGGNSPYGGVEDVMLLEWARDENFGARPDFDIGQNEGQRAHALLRFDLSPLKSKVDRILSATLILTPNDGVFYFPWKSPGNIELYRVSDTNGAWKEGNANRHASPAAPQEGAVSWNRLSHPDRRWTGSHGASSSGADFNRDVLASVMYAPRTDFPLRFQIAGDLQFIHDWIDGQPNSGFLLRETTGDGENRINFHSSESENVAARPQLVIQYLPADTNPDAAMAESETN